MTVIAWDGVCLASDGMGEFGGTKVRVRKVHKVTTKKHGVALVGCAGQAGASRKFLEWIEGGSDRPAIDKEIGFSALVIDTARRIWKYEFDLIPIRYYMPFCAIGSGRGEALGAMAMGADARKAVRVAIRFDASCGLGVDVVRF